MDHSILLNKLTKYGIHGVAHDWFRSYLQNRTQYTTFNFVDSSIKTITCGVPQGSILGPLLFLLYVNDIANVSATFMSILFADDTNMFLQGRNINTLIREANEELAKLVTWLQVNRLSLNVDKTKFLIFR